jgi:hypothetical protein
LIAELTRHDVDRYLADRRSRGFNTLLVNLLEHAFASKAPANAYGDAPFKTPGDFSTPNEAYFAHADWVLRRASSMGFLVLLAPAYIGFRGTSHGWWREMVSSGPEKLREYGRYLGRRYSRLKNIVWVQGGDDNPAIEGVVDAVAAGISEADPDALQTGHPAPESATLDTWNGRTWVDVNTVYTYKDVYVHSLAAYRRSELPFFLLESAYEDERPVSVRRLRAQAWNALLTGATGEMFGNNPIWHFTGPGLEAPPRRWQQALNSPGARSMSIVAQVYGSLPWWRLVPDVVGAKLLLEGRGTGEQRAVAALACDGRWALAYLPGAGTVTLELGSFRGSRVTLTWIDPTSGTRSPATPGSTRTTRDVRLSTPGRNAGGAEDWLLYAVAR